MQTQTSNTLHNAIMEAGSKDRPPMLAPDNDIYSIVDACPNACEIWKAIERLKQGWIDKEIPIYKGSHITRTERFQETYKNVSQDIRDQLNAEAEAVQIILTGIDNDIYSTVDVCPNVCEMWKAIERLKQGESINVQDLETNLYWEFGKFISQDGESLESYYLRFYNMMNELIRNQCKVANHQVNVQFLLQLQPEWQRAERIARVANPLALVAQHQQVYHPQTHPTHYTQNSSTRSQQAVTRNRRKIIVNSPQPIYDQEPSMVAEDDETSKDKEIDKLMALISLSFKKIYKPTNNNLRTSSNTSRANQDNSPRINRSAGYENQRIGNVAGARETVGSTTMQKSRIQCYNCKEFGHVARECQKPKRVKDVAYHREKMLLCKQKEAGIQLNAEQADWRDDTDDDELEDQELKAHYMYMAQLQEVSPDGANSGPIFDDEPLQKKIYKPTNNNLRISSNTSRANQDNSPMINRSAGYENQRIGNVAGAREPVGSTVKLKRVKDAAYHREKMLLYKQEEAEIQLNAEQADWRDDTNDDELEDQELEAHYISQQTATRNRGKAIVNSPQPIYDQEPSMVPEDDETSKHKEIDKLMALISLSLKIYKPTNNNLQTSSNTTRTNQDNSLRINRSDRHVARECQKPKRAKDAAYHREKMLLCKQEEARIQLNAEQADWRDDTDDDELEDQELEAHYMYMAQLQEVSPDAADSGPIFDDEPLKKVSNDDHYNVFAIESAHPEQSKSMHDTYPIEQDAYSVIIYSLDMSYDRVEIDQNDDDNDLAKKQLARRNSRENENKPSAHQETISILSQQKEAQIKLYKTQEDKELDKVIELENRVKVLDNIVYKIGHSVQTMNMLNNKCQTSFAKPEFLKKAQRANPRLCLNEEMVADLRYFNSLELEVDSLRSQLETQKTQFLNEIDRLSMEYYYADHMNAILGVYTGLDKVTNLQCDYLELLEKYEGLETELLKSKMMSKSFEALQKHAINLEIDLQQCVPLCQILHCLLILLQLIEIVLFIIDSGCSTHMTRNLKLLINFVEKFFGTVKFRNDQIAPILGYGDLKSTCFIHDLKGNDLLTGSRGTDLYSITLQDTNSHNPICLVAKATSSQAWLWHRRLSHLNFDTINLLSKNDIVVGLPKLKFVKDHLCSFCDLGKAKRKSKDETPKVLIDFLRLVQRGLQAQEIIVRTDKGTEFLNQNPHAYFAEEGIHHQTSVARTPKQNDVVERRNRTLVEAARTMLSAAKVPLFFWAEAIATACFTQNCSLVIPRHEKTSYHIINNQKPSVKFFYIFGSLCYIVKDGENLDKMKEKELPQMASDHVSSNPAPECQRMALKHDSLSPKIQRQENVPQADRTVTTSNELDFLFSLMFDELLNGSSNVVSMSSDVSSVDAPNQCQQHTTPLNNHTTPASTCQVLTLAPTVSSSENINQAETYANDQVADDEFINIFCTLVQNQRERSSRHVDSSNMHTFYQRYPSEHRWIKDHPIEQVIGNPSQSVRTIRQPESNAKIYHPLEQVIGNPSQSVRTIRQPESNAKICMFVLTMSQTEPKNIKEAMADSAWIESMQEELHQFDRLDIWELVDRPLCTNVINLKWLWKNKRDEENTVNQNKSRLVAKGYAKKEELILKNHSHPLLVFLYDPLKKEVYINQPDGFVDPYHPDKVYRLKKDLYGLKQALRAWGDLLLVKIYVDDIILIHQSPRGILINQAKYAQEILKKHGMTSCDSIGTPMATKHLDADSSRTPIDQTKYHSKVGALMYLTTSRPDIMHATCYRARYQAQLTEKHLSAIKRIFRYLKDTIHMGLWYLKDTGFELTAFLDLDHAGCLDSRKSTSGDVCDLDGFEGFGDGVDDLHSKQPFIREESPIDTMADQHTMAELLRASTEGYAEAIVVPPILAEKFKLKNRAARRWLGKEPPHSIHTWEDLVSKFINEFFPPSRITNLRNEISNFQQRFDESFHEAWDRYKDLLRACPHHGFTKLHQLDTFYNALNPTDQDSLNAAAGGNLLERRTQYVLTIIENKSKCLAAGGNTFPQLQDNIQGYVSAIAVNYNQGISVYHPPGSGSLHSNTVANPKGELKAITTRSGLVLDGPTVPNPCPFIYPEEDERVEETLTDPDLSEYTIKVLPPPVQKYKPLSQREYVMHHRDPLHPNIPYPLRMLKQKQQEKDEVQIHKFWQMFKQLHVNITLADALLLMPKYQKILKALLSNKEKLQELANTPLNKNCLVVILKKLPKKIGHLGKFLILCGFSELKCKALANLGASINLMALSVWKKLGLPELISSRMTLELANRAICTPVGIARDVFVLVGKFTFLVDFVIVDYESDPSVPLILGRPFLRTARALIDVHGKEMILRDGDERLTLNMRLDTSSYSNQPQKESINLINVFNNSCEDFLEDLFSTNQPSGNPTFSSHPELTLPKVKDDIFDPKGGNVLPEKSLDLDSTKDLYPPLHVNPLSGSTTYSSSPNPLLEELVDEIDLITFPPKYDDDLQFDVESDLKEIEFLLYLDIDSSLKDSINQSNLANPVDNFVDSMPEMFTDEHALDYPSPSIFDVYDDDFLEVESDTENVYDDPFDSKGEKIKVSKLLIDELDLLCDFIPSEYDSFISQDFSRVDVKPSTNNEDKDFDPPFYEPFFFKEVPRSNMLLPFSSENEEKVFNPGIHTSEKVHSSRIPELSHQGYKVFKINQVFKSPMKIFRFSCGKDTHIFVVPCLQFYPLDQFKFGGIGSS
nr:putative ribonuclease H-like domain-containing protein [Tanacetum cinerariifolium]